MPPCCGPGGVRGLVAAAWLLLLGRQVSRDTMLAFVVEEGESWARQWLSPLGEDILVAFSPRCEADTPPQRGQSTERRNVVRANHKVFLLVVARVCRREHTNNPACGGRAVSQMREHDRAIVEEENPGRASDVFSDRQHGHARGIMSVDTTKPQRVEWWRAGAGDDPPEPHTPPRPGWPLRRV